MRTLFGTIAATAIATLLVLPLAALDADAATTLDDLKILTVAWPTETPAQCAYIARVCPPNVWTLTADRTKVVCCNGYGTDDGITDGSCATRSIQPPVCD